MRTYYTLYGIYKHMQNIRVASKVHKGPPAFKIKRIQGLTAMLGQTLVMNSMP